MVKSHNPTPEEALSAWLDDTPPTPADVRHWPASALNEPDAAPKDRYLPGHWESLTRWN